MKTKSLSSVIAVVLVACSMLFASQAIAQQTDAMKKTPAEMAQMLTDKMKQNLSLTDDQCPKVYNINLKYAQKADSLVANTSMDKRQKMEAEKTNLVAKKAEIKAVLTPEQYKKFEEVRDDSKQMMKKEMKEMKKETTPKAPSTPSVPNTPEELN